MNTELAVSDDTPESHKHCCCICGMELLPIEEGLRPEMVGTYTAIALCMPLVTLTSGLKGILEGLHRFDIVNVLRVPLGVANFAAPWLKLARKL